MLNYVFRVKSPDDEIFCLKYGFLKVKLLYQMMIEISFAVMSYSGVTLYVQLKGTKYSFTYSNQNITSI